MQTVSNHSSTGLSVNRGRSPGNGYHRASVIVLLLEGFSIMQMGKLAAVFELANQLGRADGAFADHYELRLYSIHGGPVRSSSGVGIWTDATRTLEASTVHAMFVLSGQGGIDELDEQLIAWLRHAHQRARVVRGSSGGRKLLTQIHLAQKEVDNASPAVDGGGASHAGRDDAEHAGDEDDGPFSDALSIVRVDMGYEIAQEIVTCMVSGANRKLTDVLFGARVAQASTLIRRAAHHLRVNSENRISIADEAQAAAMSERNFLRRFKNEIGVTPTEFVLRIRLEKACRMLIETDLPADKVARRTGLGSGDRMAKLFRQHLQTSPTEYRAVARKGGDASAEMQYASDLSGWMNGATS
ncbi:GlxA family transcriptional regulator [Burkholderia sp. S-53]|uniref:GlxA family transcriptional regulator n=1 Tax=Burkholderia sp. S-53 TaxID=2906514 RepID=UPI0021D3616C|nr:helix-turn-helix domain-containing protein [Burkholderia sp. S-53]UXU85639.1 helix-turn-helix domain-containing protein [Burkholderia sp. S-53]